MGSGLPKRLVVLVVEDDVLVRIMAADILQDAGYHVFEAGDGIEALAVMNARDDVAALVTDVEMPRMNGVDLAKIVSKRWPHVGIVIASGALPAGVALELPRGARFLSKPYLPDTFIQDLEAVLPRMGGPITLKSLPTLQPGREFGAGGLAHPLLEPEE